MVSTVTAWKGHTLGLQLWPIRSTQGLVNQGAARVGVLASFRYKELGLPVGDSLFSGDPGNKS